MQLGGLGRDGFLTRTPSPPLPFLSLPSSPLPFPPLPLEVGPLNPARGSGERCKLPQWGADKRFGAYLGQKEQLWWQQFYGFS